MPYSDQENCEQPAKRRKKTNSVKPFALSQQMDTSSSVQRGGKRVSSVEVNAVGTKRAKSQPHVSQFEVYDESDSFSFANVSVG